MTLWIIIGLLAVAAALVKAFDRKVPGTLYKVVLLVWAIGPLVGTVWAIVLLWQQWISWLDLTLSSSSLPDRMASPPASTGC